MLGWEQSRGIGWPGGGWQEKGERGREGTHLGWQRRKSWEGQGSPSTGFSELPFPLQPLHLSPLFGSCVSSLVLRRGRPCLFRGGPEKTFKKLQSLESKHINGFKC